MDDKKRNILVEKVKQREVELNDLKADFRTVITKLDIAYQYEEDLIFRQEAAKKKTKELRDKFMEIKNKIDRKMHDLKLDVDVFTGHFYDS